VVHRFQFRDVQHYDMLEAAALWTDAVQDLTQQLQVETFGQFTWMEVIVHLMGQKIWILNWLHGF
jgi:hypothetical protein